MFKEEISRHQKTVRYVLVVKLHDSFPEFHFLNFSLADIIFTIKIKQNESDKL